ncbi:MAG: 6-bladed beta-propeller [bacterium]|nr:6-bladed beta-propeller [bacterium]
MKKTIFSLLVVILSTALVPQEKFVKNTLKELEAVKDKINLSLIRVWNDEEVDDENQFFRLPTDIKIGNDNLIYILDSGNNRIQAFDGSANYIRTIGRRGRGPGDMVNPSSVVLDKDNKIVVADTDNQRIQVFNRAGQYISSFKTTGLLPSWISVTPKKEIIQYGYGRLEKNRLLLTYYDYSGKKLRMIGKTHDTKREQSESAYFALDDDSNVLMCFRVTPYYRKYAPDGTSLMIVTFQTPHKSDPTIEPPKVPQGVPRITRKNGMDIVSISISVDKSGRVYLVISNRPKSKKEIYYLVSDGPGQMRRWPAKMEVEDTDMFSLLVFSPEGKVIASKQLNVFCDKIYVHGDQLFIVDTYMGMKIHQYKMSFTNN